MRTAFPIQLEMQGAEKGMAEGTEKFDLSKIRVRAAVVNHFEDSGGSMVAGLKTQATVYSMLLT